MSFSEVRSNRSASAGLQRGEQDRSAGFRAAKIWLPVAMARCPWTCWTISQARLVSPDSRASPAVDCGPPVSSRRLSSFTQPLMGTKCACCLLAAACGARLKTQPVDICCSALSSGVPHPACSIPIPTSVFRPPGNCSCRIGFADPASTWNPSHNHHPSHPSACTSKYERFPFPAEFTVSLSLLKSLSSRDRV